MLFEFTAPALPGPIRLDLRPESAALALGADQVLSFDGAGRLLTAFRDGRLYKRGRDQRIMEKWRPWTVGRSDHVRRDLAGDEKLRLVAGVRDTIRTVRAALPADAPPASHVRLEQLARWDAAAYAEERRRFQTIYRPVPILPPDQYLAMVLQATEGCHYNQCTFCNFYRGRTFYVKSPAEFHDHIAAVRAFLGAGVRLRRTIFLADANALVIPAPRLVEIFDAINAAFEAAPARLGGAALARWKADHPLGIAGVYSFLDAFTGKRKTRDEFEWMAGRGLRRVYIGMESGHVPLLEFLRKPSMPADVRAVVRAAKAGGVHVGLIVMLGIGGDRYAAGHVADTLDVVNSLGLEDGDILYFSEFVDEPGSEYATHAQAAGVRALASPAVRAQARAIRAGLRFERAPKLATYDIREFIY